jgi:DNA-binding transcriptional regulator PaaX
MKSKKNLYTSIEWQKVSTLFLARTKSVSANTITAEKLLYALARVAEKGFVFLAHANNPAVIEYLLEDSGPLTWRTRSMIRRFRQQKYITVSQKRDGSVMVKITKDGMQRALSYQLDTLTIQPPTHWDDKWRVVLFDVPEKYKSVRDMFRKRLCQIGLYRYQESVYVSPYPCFDQVEFLRELYGIAFTVRYLLAEKIEDDASLRGHFHL